MLVRIKKTCGNYGHVENGVIRPKNFASGAFEVSDQEGERMILRGIADLVDEPTPSDHPSDQKPKAKRTKKKSSPKAAAADSSDSAENEVTLPDDEEDAPVINAASAVY